MAALRRSLAFVDELDLPVLFTYGCSAHWANLLAKDMRNITVLDDVKTVIKYFRTHHDPKAKFKAANGAALYLPTDVRWNSYRDCVQSFVRNYSILHELATEYRRGFDKQVVEILLEHNILAECKYYLEKVDQIAIN